VIFQMFNHGITRRRFLVCAMIQDHGGHRGIDQFGGLRKPAPVLAGLMASRSFLAGVARLNGFPASSHLPPSSTAWVAAGSVLGLLVTAA